MFIKDSELDNMAEWIVIRPPELDPELVGSKLADAKYPVNSILKGSERLAEQDEKLSAMKWILEEAQKRSYPGT